MTRTAISPRLAINTLIYTVRQSGKHEPLRRPSAVDVGRLDQPVPARPGPGRGTRGGCRGGRLPDPGPGTARPELGGAAGGRAVTVGAGPAGPGGAATGEAV